MIERELSNEVALVQDDGSLNFNAVGWARRPLVDTVGIGSTSNGGIASRLKWKQHRWGRNKRWEYWNIMTPTHILAVVVSSLDYAAVNEVWIFDRNTEQVWTESMTTLPSRGVQLPTRLGAGPIRVTTKGLDIEITHEPSGANASTDSAGANYAGTITIRAKINNASFEIQVDRAVNHDCLAVVVPWNEHTYQYTVKDVALPARGTLTVDGIKHELQEGESWAILDHGRGRWPYDVRWNWGAGSGVSGGRTIGIQVGGQWTRGTGSTENGVLVDGHLHKISEELTWSHGLPDDWRSPWTIVGGGFEATFTPFYDKVTRTNLGLLAGSTDQCFGTWSGDLVTANSERISFEGIEGFAEEVHNRW
ncbi:MAG: DUF2804 domain-containing protein [Candidatus Nanopelagicales bacterium]